MTNETARIVEALQPVTLNKLTPSDRFLIIQVEPENTTKALKIMTDALGIKHLSTITGQDLGEGVCIDYQFAEPNHIVAVRTIIPKTSLKIESGTAVVPGAILYEMEIHDMFGVVFEGNPWMDRKLLLPDNYPSDIPPPLLKTTSTEKIRRAVGVEK